MRFIVEFEGRVDEVRVEADSTNVALNYAVHMLRVKNIDTGETFRVVEPFKLEKI